MVAIYERLHHVGSDMVEEVSTISMHCFAALGVNVVLQKPCTHLIATDAQVQYYTF